MSIDFQVCSPQQIVVLSGVRVLEGFSPRALDIIGDDFRSVDDVLINDLSAPEVVVVSQNRLIARVPPDVENTQISSVVVLSNQLAVTSKSLLRFRLGRTPTGVSGILRLLQLFVKVMFTTPGKDIFNKTLGGGALRALGNTYGNDKSGRILSDIIISSNTAQRQILAIQARDPSIPRDERLLSARITQSEYDPNLSSLSVVIEILSHAGQAATANFTL